MCAVCCVLCAVCCVLCLVAVVLGLLIARMRLSACGLSQCRSLKLIDGRSVTWESRLPATPPLPVSDTSTKTPQASTECAHYNSAGNTQTANK